MKLFNEEQVKKLLAEQRHNCQIERNKRSHHDEEQGWFVHCEDVMNAKEPELPSGLGEAELRQLFKNRSDCYADTWHYEKGYPEEGEVIQAMTEDRFIETLREIKP